MRRLAHKIHKDVLGGTRTNKELKLADDTDDDSKDALEGTRANNKELKLGDKSKSKEKKKSSKQKSKAVDLKPSGQPTSGAYGITATPGSKPKKKRQKRKMEAQLKKAAKWKQVALTWQVKVNPNTSKDLNALVLKSTKDQLLENQTKVMVEKKAKRKKEMEDRVDKPVKRLCVKPFGTRDQELNWNQRAIDRHCQSFVFGKACAAQFLLCYPEKGNDGQTRVKNGVSGTTLRKGKGTPWSVS